MAGGADMITRLEMNINSSTAKTTVAFNPSLYQGNTHNEIVSWVLFSGNRRRHKKYHTNTIKETFINLCRDAEYYMRDLSQTILWLLLAFLFSVKVFIFCMSSPFPARISIHG